MPKFDEEQDAAPRRPSTSNRRETILSLMEILLKQEVGNDSGEFMVICNYFCLLKSAGLSQQQMFEDDRDVRK